MATNTRPPNVSIVIPVYNEEGILHSAVVDLIELGSMVYQSTNYSEMDFSCRAAAESTYSAAGRCLLNRLESAGLKIVRATDE